MTTKEYNKQITEIPNEIIISKKINNCYLLYNSKEYYLFKPDKNSYSANKIDISENPNDVENTILDNKNPDKVSSNPTINSSLKVLMVHLEYLGLSSENQIDVIHEMFYDLSEVQYYTESDDDEYDERYNRIERFSKITDEKIIERILYISNELKRNKSESVINELYSSFKNRNGIPKAQRDLGNYLNKKCGIILRKNSHELYKLDQVNNVIIPLLVMKLLRN